MNCTVCKNRQKRNNHSHSVGMPQGVEDPTLLVFTLQMQYKLHSEVQTCLQTLPGLHPHKKASSAVL